MSKKTIQLSVIFDQTVSEMHTSPCTKGFETIRNIVHSIQNARIALRVQMVNKMKAYYNRVLSVREMYYCLCLFDYLVKHEACIRQQVLEPEFIKYFECIFSFGVCAYLLVDHIINTYVEETYKKQYRD